MSGTSTDDVPTHDLAPERARRDSGVPAVLTFLIADVRGYTRFAQEHGDEEAGRLAADFATLVRETVVAGGGELIELRGDEALCFFGSARQAVTTAVDLQMAFRRESDGGTTFPLPIGAGLDAGEAVPIEGGYRGGALNTAARLCSIARPGETLATDTVVSLARRLEGIRYVPRRSVRLKGLDKPIRVIEVAPEAGLPPLPADPSTRRPKVTRRRLTVAALLVAALAGALAFALVRSNRSDALSRVEPNSIAAIDGDTADVSAQVKLESAPTAIATGGGSVWVANELAGTVSRLNPTSNLVHTTSVDGHLGGIAYGARSVWVTKSDARALVQINPRTSEVVQNIPVGNAPGAVAVGPDAVWVANTVDGTVSRVGLAGGSVTDTIAVGPNPAGLAVARDGVWVAIQSTGSAVRIDPRARAVVKTVYVGNGPTGIAVGGGNVWVANTRDGTVSRIDPTTNRMTATLRVGRNPSALAATPQGVWVANGGEDTIKRVDSRSAEVDRTVTLGSRPSGIALSGGTVYAAAVVPLEGHRGGVLKVTSEPSECRCADPIFALGPNVTDFGVASLVYDGLVAYRRVGGSAGAELVPDLAGSLPTSTDDGRTYSVQLRDGIRFSYGTPVRAADFRASVERDLAVNPFSAFQGVVGAAHCSAKACDLSRGIEVDDAKRTIIIHLSRADPDFIYKLALPEAAMLPARKAPWTKHAHSIPRHWSVPRRIFSPRP